jgi:signal transduction histidine kinase
VTALRMDVSLLRLEYAGDNPALLERLKATLGLVDRAIKNVRNVATNLRPAVLDMGLLDSLKWLCNEFTDHSGIPCKLHYTDDYYLIDEPRAVQIFRIMQESLTNIARHAHARQVDVTLRCHGHTLCLDVRDDGIGFDVANQSQKSFGLLGIRERAIVLGGDVDIMSVLGQGTTVALQIPLE